MKKCQPRSLTPYLDGELAPDTRAQVEEHLRSCASCGALLDEVTSARERVREMGRAIIPETILMLALEIFREKGGIGQAGDLQAREIPVPASVETVAVMDEDAATDVAEAEIDEDERYNEAVNTPGPATDPAPTWVNVASPDASAPPEIPAPPPAPEPFAPADWPAMPESPNRSPSSEAAPPGDFWAIAESGAAPAQQPSASARWLGSGIDEAISPEAQYALETSGAALEELPEPPAPQALPPWADAETADAEDVEAHGRRLIEEDLEAERIHAAGRHRQETETIIPAVTTRPFDEQVSDSPETASHSQAESEVPAETEDKTEADSVVDGYRGALRREAGERRGPAGLGSLSSELKIGLGLAAAIVLLLAAIAMPRLFTQRSQPVASAAHPSAAPSAAASPRSAAAPASSPVASAAPVVPALTGVVSAGHGGTGYQVLGVRTRNPSAGLNLIVFDLQGSGPLPDATVGQAADGSLYLQSPGTTIDPAIATAFAGAGPVSSMAPTGGGATSLKLSTSRPVRFLLYYLTGPSRLVIELR